MRRFIGNFTANFVTSLLFAGASVFAAPWPAFRGPAGTGISPETDIPLHWNVSENIRWSAPLPDRGNSTPVVWRDRIFLTQAIEKENRRLLLCLDRATGQVLWRAGTEYSEKEPTHEINPHCSASPATDGERVIASFGSAGLYAYDFAGKEIWRRDLGKQIHIWGNASSPVISQGLCFFNYGPGTNSGIAALDLKTGELRWQHPEPGGDSGEERPGQPEWIGSWSTPILVQSDNRAELIVSFPKRVAAFNPQSGQELWSCAGLNALVYTSPLEANGIVVAMGGYNGSALAVRTGGEGDVTASRRLWQIPRTRQRIGSGVIVGGAIYILDQPGVAECIDLKTGGTLWEERLQGPSKRSQSWSSTVAVGNKWLVTNEAGETFVLLAQPKFELISVNPLGEKTMASPAVSDGEIFIRTYQHLFCIGKK